MKNMIKNLSVIILLLLSLSSTYAEDAKVGDYLQNQNFTDVQKDKNLTMQGLFLLYFNAIGE
jgi:hypothetical protein